MVQEVLRLQAEQFNRKEYESLLRTLIRNHSELALNVISQLALRSAMRAIPLLARSGDLNFWRYSKKDSRVRYLARVLGIFSLSMRSDIYETAHAIIATKPNAYHVNAIVSRVVAAAAAAADAAAAVADADADAAIGAAVDAADAADAIDGGSLSLYSALNSDIKDCQKNEEVLFANETLWKGNVPEWYIVYLHKLEMIISQLPRIEGEQKEWDIIESGLDLLRRGAGVIRTDKQVTPPSFLPTNQSHPENPSVTDKLNRQKLVNALAINLTHSTNNHHRAIGLLGEWGSGKSTVLKLLKEKLQKSHTEQPFVFGEFNAWAYEHTDNIQAGVAQEMINALTSLSDNPSTGIRSLWFSIGWFFQRAWLTLQFSVKTHPFEILKILVLLLIAAMPWFTDWFDGLINDKDLAIVGQWVWSGGLVLYTLREFGKLIISPQAKELLTYLRLPSYAEHLGKIPVMRKHISTLCGLRLKAKNGKTPRLLFVVDDLDRCSPEAIVKVLEAVRLVLDLENVIVIIAIDQHIALAALSKHFNDFAIHHKLKNSHAIAREYLSKVINLPIVLTAPSGDDVHVFMADLWKDMPRGSAVGASGAGQEDPVDNPSKPVTSKTNLPTVDPKAQPDNVPVVDGSPSPGPAMGGKPTAPEDGQPSGGEINPIKALSPEQQQSFIHWVNYFELTNPRQLKRLNNSYDLMRSYFVDWDKAPVAFNFPNENSKPVYPMLLTLILMEYLNSFEDLAARGRLWKKLFPQEIESVNPVSKHITLVDPGVFDKKSVNPAFINAYRELYKLEGYGDMAEKVEAFVLPAMV